MKHKKAAICGAVLLVLIVGFLYLRGTPYYSIYQLIRAVNDHNAEEALKYIDVDSVAESLAKNFFAAQGEKRKFSKGINDAISMNMPSIKEGLRAYLISLIRSQDAVLSPKGGVLGALDIHDIHVGVIWRLHVRTEGTTAFVSLKDKPWQKAKMTRTGEGYWKFTEVAIDKPGKE